MSASEETSRGGSSARTGVPSEKSLLVAIAIGFLILHILAGVMLLAPSSETVPPQPPIDFSSGD